MPQRKSARAQQKNIALVAHDQKKRDLIDWAKNERDDDQPRAA